MLLTYNWQIYDYSIPDNDLFIKYLPIPKPTTSDIIISASSQNL